MEGALILKQEELEKLWTNNKTSYRNRDQIKWSHDLRSSEEDIINLPEEIKQPMKKDKETGELKPIFFRASVFFKTKEFIEKCQSYYDKFNLSFRISGDKFKKGIWWVSMQEKDGTTIFFPEKS